MTVYCDTTFLISFLNEDDVNHLMAQESVGKRDTDDFVVCEVQLLEFPAAVRAATHRGQNSLPEYQARKIINRFDRFINAGEFTRKSLNISESISMARSLGEAHGWRARHAAFDLWHLAAAWSLSAGAFLTFDRRQAVIARSLGLAP